MDILGSFRSRLASFVPGRKRYELDDEWEQLLEELRKEVKEDGFDLEENEELYLSVIAHVVEENREGFEMLADEEAAERARMNEDREEVKGSGVKIETISPGSD